MNVEEILDRLDRVKRNGSQWLARCPAHEDNKPSLSVREDGDVILLHCFAGCDTADVCDRIGIEIGDLFNRPLTPRRTYMPQPRKPNPEPDPAAEQRQAEYVAALLARPPFIARLCVLRQWSQEGIELLGLGYDEATERVTFPVRLEGRLLGHLHYKPAAEDDESKMISDPGVPRVLFPDPAGLPEPDPDTWFWIVEGEPDVVAAYSAGMIAIGVPGSQAWHPDWAEYFTGRNVVISTDADDAGRALADRIERDIKPFAACVARLDPQEVEEGFAR
jgi:CHC2 zinc finger/Toprim-like